VVTNTPSEEVRSSCRTYMGSMTALTRRIVEADEATRHGATGMGAKYVFGNKFNRWAIVLGGIGTMVARQQLVIK
jgi:hypothetical protein